MKGRTQDEYNERYYQEMFDVVKAFKGYDVLAHVDLIARYDPAGPIAFEKIQGILTEIFKIVIADGKGIELNTSSWHYGLKDTTPARDILKLYRSLGGKVLTMGSDAHKPEFLADHMQDAQTILRDLGFTEIYTFDHHNPIAHAL